MTGTFNIILLTLIAGGLFTSNFLVNAYGKNVPAGYGEWAPDTYFIEINVKPNVATPIWSIKLYSNDVLVPSILDPLTGSQACITTTAGHGVNEVNDGNDDTYGTFTATNCGSGANRLRIQALNAKDFDTVVVSSRTEIFGAGQTVVKYRNWCDWFSNNRCKWKTPQLSTGNIPLVPLSAGDKEKFTCPFVTGAATACFKTTYAVDIYLDGNVRTFFTGENYIWFVKMFNNGVQIPMSQLSISYPACIETRVHPFFSGDFPTAYLAIDTDDNSYGYFMVNSWCEPGDRKITVSSGRDAPFDLVTVKSLSDLWGQRVEMYRTTVGVKTSLHDTIVPPVGSEYDKIVFNFTNPTYDAVVKITQTNAVIDASPTINFSEIEFYLNGVKRVLMNTDFTFVQKSAGYPAALCNDGNKVTMPSYNMCKSGNGNPDNQTMYITPGPTHFNKIVVYNAYGFNNPGGFDVGNRILNATLQIMSGTTVVHTYTFNSVQPNYTIEYPSFLTDRPRLPPPTLSLTFIPTTRAPAPVQPPTQKPTAMPSIFRPTTRAPV